jgi:hypothetical protein
MWTVRSTLSEVLRNLRGVHVLLAMGVVAALTLPAMFEATTVRDDIAALDRWVREGGTVYTVERDEGVPGDLCDVGSRNPAIVAAGGAGIVGLSPESLTFDRSPGVEYSVLDMTPGAVRVLTGSDGTLDGWILGQTVLDELGVDLGASLSSGADTADVVATIGAGHRQLGYDRNVIRPLPAGEDSYSVCWIEFTTSSFAVGPDVIAGLIPYEDEVVRPFNRTDQEDLPVHRYRMRPSQHVWLAAGAAIGVLWLLWWWIRRREFTLYRSLGMSRGGVSILGLGEAVVVTVTSAVVSAGFVLWRFGGTSAAFHGLWTVAAATVLGIGLAQIAIWPLAARDLARASKDL